VVVWKEESNRVANILSLAESSTKEETPPKSILIVDDEETFRGILRSFVESLGYVGVEAGSAREALQLLKRTHFAIVISDIVMPEMDGLELLRTIKKRHSDVDVLIVTAYRGSYSPMNIVQAGASDFLAKPFSMEQLGARLHKIETERTLRDKLYVKSITDELTGLYNRGYFYQKLKREMERAKRQGHALSIIMLDVDRFKEFNDRYGHLKGDALLRTGARVLQFSVREHVDCVFRYGGDEFVVILPETDEKMGQLIGDRIKVNFQDAVPHGLTLSFGVAELSEGSDVEAFVNLADKRMYEEKLKAKGLDDSQVQIGMEENNHCVRCLNCGNLVHWTSSLCKNCLADPLRETDSQRGREIARSFLKEVHPSLEDRRKSPRVRIRKPLVDDQLKAIIHNISWGGLQIRTETPLSVGGPIRIAFPVEGKDVKFGGIVVYVQSLTEGGSLAGIRFSEISEENSKLLKRFLDQQSSKKA
jgi:diguanylate cyclase (GGDEF)-like protein